MLKGLSDRTWVDTLTNYAQQGGKMAY